MGISMPDGEGARPVALEIVIFTTRSLARLPCTMDAASALLQVATGYRAHRFGPCVEEPGRYALLIWWNTIEDHVITFRQSSAYREWRSLLDECIEGDPFVRHFMVPT